MVVGAQAPARVSHRQRSFFVVFFGRGSKSLRAAALSLRTLHDRIEHHKVVRARDLTPQSWLLVGLVGLGIALGAFAAAAEMALASVSRLQFREMLAAGQSRARVAEMLLSAPARLLSTLLVTKIIGYVIVAAGGDFLSRGRSAAWAGSSGRSSRW